MTKSEPEENAAEGCIGAILIVVIAFIVLITLINFERRLTAIEAKLGLHGLTAWETVKGANK